MNKFYYIDSKQLESFLGLLARSHKVFLPALKEETPQGCKADYYCVEYSEGKPFVFNPYRVVEPLKSFFTYSYEEMAEYFAPEKQVTEIPVKTVIFGVKSCDIAGHKIQDFVFLEGVAEESVYRMRRDSTIFISSDCTDYKDVCHCLAWEIPPYPTEGFDINLSPLADGYLVEVGSKKGEELLDQYKEYFTEAGASRLTERDANRKDITERLNRHLRPQNLVSRHNVQGIVKKGYNADTWRQFMLTCVECGGCNFICDTCHCFLMMDKKKDGMNEKARVWDSCLYANYARVAGGANPLRTRAQRLRNRFMKKFDFFVDNLGIPACCGCGRCIEVCPGKIDIREVLKDLAAKAETKQS